MLKPKAALFLLLFCGPAAVANAQQPPKGDESSFLQRLPRGWCGVFRWVDEDREQQVTVVFHHAAARADGRIELKGPGFVRYEHEPPQRGVPFTMQAVVEPATRRIELFETIDTPRVDYVTNGSHVGELAEDLQSMQTVWTTRSDGRRGTMRLNARPARAELTQPCAPPSSRAPGPPLHNSLINFAALTRAGKFAIN